MNDSTLPRSSITRCNNLLETIEIDADKALKIIRSLDNWKKANLLPIHKKESRQLKKKLQTDIDFTRLWKNF